MARPCSKAGERRHFAAMQDVKPERAVESDCSWHLRVPSVTALIPSIMERTFLFHFPGRRRQARSRPSNGMLSALLRIEEGIDPGEGVMPRYFDHMPATK